MVVRSWSAWFFCIAVLLGAELAGSPAPAWAQGAGPLLKLLQSGRLPAERRPTVLEMVCKKGDADDLAYVFSQVLDPQAYPPDLRLKALDWLTEAAKINKVKPAGDLTVIERLLSDGETGQDPAFTLAVIRLAAEWHVTNVADELQRIALAGSVDPRSADPRLQAAAISGLTTIGGDECRATIEQLTHADRPTAIRFRAVAALAALDLDAAARAAALALADATGRDEPAAVVQAFLERQHGPDKLAAALAEVQLDRNVAKLALRAMYTAGRSDASLSNVLSRAAGIALDAPPPTNEEVNRLVAEVLANGDPARGERVFRRSDVNCMKCHSVSGGGGTIGPDLSPIGSTSPVEYVVNSILNPNLAIKEAYITKNIVTSGGQVFSGIVVDRNDQAIKLKDALGTIIEIPTADVDEEVEGKSLMPQGLTKFLTHDEFLDLARFISELGKAGPYAVRSTPTVQRWRVLRNVPPALVAEAPNPEFLRQLVLAIPADGWLPAFGMVGGVLPLDELKPADGQRVLYLQGTIDVVEPGPIGVEVQSNETLHAWLDVTSFDPQSRWVTELAKGLHTLTIRVALSDRPEPQLKAQFFKPAGSPAQFTVQ